MRKIVNEQTHRKPAVASMVKDSEMEVPLGVRCVVLFTLLVFANLPAVAFA